MEKLSEKEWKEYRIGDLYTVSRPVARNKDLYEEGKVPFVASGSANNGVIKCCKPKKDEELDPGNCITVSPVDGSSFFQPFSFLGRGGAGSSILLLQRKDIDLLSGLFEARMIQQTCSKYSYGHMGNKDGIKREIIQLPAKNDGKPDYAYMERFVASYRAKILRKYKSFLTKRLKKLEYKKIPIPEEKRWKPIKISDIADVYSGHDIYAQDRIPGKNPLVTAIGNNNGIGYFVGNTNDSFSRGMISVVRNGASVAQAFYHRYTALFGNDCRRLKLKESNSEFVGLFIAPLIAKQKKAFSYSRKLGSARLANLKIMLPVNAFGSPDYAYMEQYSKNLMLKKYQQYLKFLERHYPEICT